MKSLFFTAVTLFLLLFCGHAQAQFSQPPTNQPVPVCRNTKSQGEPIGSDCKLLLVGNPATRTMLRCDPSPVITGLFECVTSTSWFDGIQWRVLDPSTLTHDWAFIVNGNESYPPSNYFDSFNIACGRVLYNYVRVTAGGSTAQATIICTTPFPFNFFQ